MTPEEHLSAHDPILAKIIQSTPTFKKTDWNQDMYLALLESIVSQQISVKAADSIFARLRALFPNEYPAAQLLLEKSDDELRSAGLSFQKINYLRNVANFMLEKGIDYHTLDALSDEEIVAYLTPIKGVGKWTVEMLLMFVMNRPDVFPVDDLVIRQKMIKAYQVTETGKVLYQKLHQIAESWRPFRTQACRYLWRWQPES
jgi:DNA-3-methyladenine glycosylase II